MTTRRTFLKGIIGVAGAFIVPEIIIPERRFWQLDRTMLGVAEPWSQIAPHPWMQISPDWYAANFNDPLPELPLLQAGTTYRVKVEGLSAWEPWPGQQFWNMSHIEDASPFSIAVFSAAEHLP